MLFNFVCFFEPAAHKLKGYEKKCGPQNKSGTDLKKWDKKEFNIHHFPPSNKLKYGEYQWFYALTPGLLLIIVIEN